jgi:hypothetical protein
MGVAGYSAFKLGTCADILDNFRLRDSAANVFRVALVIHLIL